MKPEQVAGLGGKHKTAHTSKAGQLKMWQANHSELHVSFLSVPEPQLINQAGCRNATEHAASALSSCAKESTDKGQELSLLRLTPVS